MSKIILDKRNNGRLIGPIDEVMFVSNTMPGQWKFDERELLFQLTRANIEHVRKILPKAEWDEAFAERLGDLENMSENEKLNLIAKAKNRLIDATTYPFEFKTLPLQHQIDDFDTFKDEVFFGLFWEQGLGKTKQILDIAAYKWKKGEINAVLIVAPNGVHMQWLREQIPVHLPDWCPRKYIGYRAANQTKAWKSACDSTFDYKDGLRFFAINQEAISSKGGDNFITRALMQCRTMWVFDESSGIQTAGSERAKSAIKRRTLARVRVILDGTPVGKGAEDLYPQLGFLHPDITGYNSFGSYRDHYCHTRAVPGAPAGVVMITGYKNIDELKHRMNAYCSIRKIDDCVDLPPKIYMQRRIDLSDEQRKLCDQLLDEMITEVNGSQITTKSALVRIGKLQQITCGFVRSDDGEMHYLDSNRIKAAKNHLQQAQGKIVIWARYHEDIDQLWDLCVKMKLNPVRYDGRIDDETKRRNKIRFIKDDQCMVFLGNQQSAGTGTDGLQTVCHEQLFYSNDFSARRRWQAESRLYRLLQKQSTIIGDIIAERSIDIRLAQVLRKRKDIADFVMDQSFLQSLRFDSPLVIDGESQDDLNLTMDFESNLGDWQ